MILFALQKNKIVMLNTFERQLEFYEDGNLIKTVLLPFCTYPVYMECVDSFILILDTEEQKLALTDLEGRFLQKVNIEFDGNDRYVYMSRVGCDIVYIETQFGKATKLLLREGEVSFENFPDLNEYVMVPLGERRISGHRIDTVGDLIYSEGDVKIYLTMDSMTLNGREYREIGVKKYQKDTLSKAYFLEDTMAWMPSKGIRIDKEEKVQLLLFGESELVYSSKEMKPISESVSRLENYIENFTYEDTKIAEGENANMVSSTTRAQALNTAYRYTSYSWKITKANQKTLSNTKLPGYISALDLSSGEKVLQGIPYCWGAWDTFDGFKSGIARGGQAGNITSANKEWRAGTNGVDCSGLISRAYNLNTKYGTTMLGESFKATTYNAACCSDFFLKSGHVVLFHRKVSTTNYLIVDSTTESIDKVTSRVLSQTLLDSKNYAPYTGWTAGHKESSEWSSDSGYHYHTCVNGCEKKYTSYAHTWVVSSGKKRCSVCGFQTTV